MPRPPQRQGAPLVGILLRSSGRLSPQKGRARPKQMDHKLGAGYSLYLVLTPVRYMDHINRFKGCETSRYFKLSLQPRCEGPSSILGWSGKSVKPISIACKPYSTWRLLCSSVLAMKFHIRTETNITHKRNYIGVSITLHMFEDGPLSFDPHHLLPCLAGV